MSLFHCTTILLWRFYLRSGHIAWFLVLVEGEGEGGKNLIKFPSQRYKIVHLSQPFGNCSDKQKFFFFKSGPIRPYHVLRRHSVTSSSVCVNQVFFSFCLCVCVLFLLSWFSFLFFFCNVSVSSENWVTLYSLAVAATGKHSVAEWQGKTVRKEQRSSLHWWCHGRNRSRSALDAATDAKPFYY